MLQTFFFMVMVMGAIGLGYGFKKSWILWVSVPFWILLGLWISYFQAWFSNPTAQHSLILVGIAGAVATMFGAVRMQVASLSNSATDMDGDDELDDDDKEFFREKEQYDRNSKIYKTKLKPRKLY